MEDDKEDETMEGNHKEDEGNANEDELQQTPTKRMCYVVNTSPTVYAANATYSKYRRIQGSPLNATARKLLLAKLGVKINSQGKILYQIRIVKRLYVDVYRK